MAGWLIGISFLFFLLFFLYHSSMHVELRFRYGGFDNNLSASVRLLGGILWFRLEGAAKRDEKGRLFLQFMLNDKPLKKVSEKKKRKKQKPSVDISDWKQWMEKSERGRDMLIRYLDLRSLGMSMTIGIACDAAATAKACGLALTVLECAAGVLRALKPNARILMRSAPNYREDCLRIRFSCIFAIKIGHIMLIGINILTQFVKGAFSEWLIRLKASCAPPWKTSKT